MKLQLTQLTEHTWLYPHSSNPNAVQSSVGVIATQNESILIDAGNSPRLARKIKRELARCNLPPVTRRIYTHHHWDHIYGGCEFDVPVTAHAKCRDILEVEAVKPWGPEYLSEEIKRNPRLRVSYRAQARAIDDWEAFRIVVPDQVFELDKTIKIDDLTIELEHVGGEHAGNSIVVKVPQDGVMFLGDCYYIPPLHLRGPESLHSVDMLSRLENVAYDLYVESHDDPFSCDELLEFLEQNN